MGPCFSTTNMRPTGSPGAATIATASVVSLVSSSSLDRAATLAGTAGGGAGGGTVSGRFTLGRCQGTSRPGVSFW
jgi:hypothetical protein